MRTAYPRAVIEELRGVTPAVEAAVVKDLGPNWEQALPNKARLMAPVAVASTPEQNDDRCGPALRHTTMCAPKFTSPGRPRPPRHRRGGGRGTRGARSAEA